jgi:GDP-L-fucose synthase
MRLITGKGLVGSKLTGEKKIGREFDLRSKKQTQMLLNYYRPKEVIHTAAKVGGIMSNMKNKACYFYDNLMINTNIIEECKNYNVEKLVVFLSTCIFPDEVQYPLTESKIHDGPPHDSNYGYAYSKRMADIQLRSIREQYNLNYKSVIPTNIYGENDNFSLSEGHVIPMLIHRMHLAKENNKDFIVWGTGKPKREFIYSKDVAELTEWVIDNYKEKEPIIFSNSQEVSIEDLVDLLVQEFNFKGRVIFDKDKPDGQFRKPSDNHKIKKYIPDFKFTPIEKGLKNTIEWFIENYPNIRK